MLIYTLKRVCFPAVAPGLKPVHESGLHSSASWDVLVPRLSAREDFIPYFHSSKYIHFTFTKSNLHKLVLFCKF